MPLDSQAIDVLKQISTATITTVLLRKGLRNVWMRGTRPLRPGQPRIVGPAFTLRFVPAREDLATPASWGNPISTRAAIEAMPPECVVVADAMGITDAGIFGDILCARMVKRNVAALVTDGAVRDVEGVLKTGLPVWCQSVAAPPSVAALTFVAFGGLSLYALLSRRDFSAWGSFFMIGLLVLFVASLINAFVGSASAGIWISAVGVLIFSGLLVFDTWRILRSGTFGPDDYVIAAVQIYLDLLNMFLFILTLLSGRNRR